MILEAGALRLLPADTALAPRTAAYYARNRAFLRPFEPERPQAFFTVEGQRDILLRELLAAQGRRAYRFYIEPKCVPALVVGSIGLNDVVWGAFCSAFLGYKLDAAYTGKGYMTEAVRLVVEYAFTQLGLHRIEANVMPRNTASLRVVEKNGFVPEGLARKYLKINGVWEDHLHMVKLNEAMHAGKTREK